MALREAIQKGFLSCRPKKTKSFPDEKIAPCGSALASLIRLHGEKSFSDAHVVRKNDPVFFCCCGSKKASL